jgi:hypothetical protein
MKIILTTKLKNAINSLNLSNIRKNKALNFIDFLMEQYQYNNEDSSGFIRISVKAIIKLYTWRYNQLFMKQLCDKKMGDNKIIIRRPFNNPKYEHSFSEESISFGYKINFEYLDFSSLEPVDYIKFKSNSNKHHKQNLAWVIADLRCLQFNTDKMIEETKSFNTDKCAMLNDDIEDKIVELVQKKNEKSFTVVMPIEKVLAKARAKKQLTDVIQYKGVVYLEHYPTFKKQKETSKKLANLQAISRLINQDFYASRNFTNNRLDTNLTNLDKVFFEKSLITLDGEPLVEIDLKNAQPTFLAYVMNTSRNPTHPLNGLLSQYQFPSLNCTNEDVVAFINSAASGTLYEKIQEIGPWKRDVAKKIFLKIMFSSEKHHSSFKKQLKKAFPTVIAWMDQFKMMNANTTTLSSEHPLSDLLQKIESAIFIDDVYFSLKKQGFLVFSKHDCIMCKASEREVIKKQIEERLDRYGFTYRLS